MDATNTTKTTAGSAAKRTSWQWARVTGSVEFHAMKNARSMECGASWSRGARLEQPNDGGPLVVKRCETCCSVVGRKVRVSTRVPQLMGLCRCCLVPQVNGVCAARARADRAAEVESVTYYANALSKASRDWHCNECGKRFTAKQAKRALYGSGCACGGYDIDLAVSR